MTKITTTQAQKLTELLNNYLADANQYVAEDGDEAVELTWHGIEQVIAALYIMGVKWYVDDNDEFVVVAAS